MAPPTIRTFRTTTPIRTLAIQEFVSLTESDDYFDYETDQGEPFTVSSRTSIQEVEVVSQALMRLMPRSKETWAETPIIYYSEFDGTFADVRRGDPDGEDADGWPSVSFRIIAHFILSVANPKGMTTNLVGSRFNRWSSYLKEAQFLAVYLDDEHVSSTMNLAEKALAPLRYAKDIELLRAFAERNNADQQVRNAIDEIAQGPRKQAA